MAKKTYKLGEETDWATRFGLYAMNNATKLFENTSWTKGMTAEVFDVGSNDEVSDQLEERIYKEKKSIEFFLYDDMHYLAGFVYEDEEDKPKEEPKKRVFRFHAHTWNDVVVDESELNLEGDESEEIINEMFYDKAQDKYNEGIYDYDSTCGNFENTDVEEITDYLKSNKIYPFDK